MTAIRTRDSWTLPATVHDPMLHLRCSATAHDRVIAPGTHLMHLETGRAQLQRVVNQFLLECTS